MWSLPEGGTFARRGKADCGFEAETRRSGDRSGGGWANFIWRKPGAGSTEQNSNPMCPPNLHWHLIGHLQSNKAKLAASGLFRMIHSVDSEKLLRALDEHAATPLPILIQVNVSGEGSKSGCAPNEAAGLIEAANTCSQVEVHGLMTIPPFTPDPEKARKVFSNLRKFRDELQEKTGTPLPELSMGMSHDFEIAIEEGSTLVRIGTDIFGKREF